MIITNKTKINLRIMIKNITTEEITKLLDDNYEILIEKLKLKLTEEGIEFILNEKNNPIMSQTDSLKSIEFYRLICDDFIKEYIKNN